MVLSTLGYEGTSLPDFIKTLRQNNIKIVIDVRENPISRKKGFSKNALKDAVQENGIQYVHLPRLGSRREIRKKYRVTKDWEWFSEEYKQVIESEPDEIEKLSELIIQDHCCLVCFEADYSLCHRSLLSKYLISHVGEGLSIENLVIEGKERLV